MSQPPKKVTKPTPTAAKPTPTAAKVTPTAAKTTQPATKATQPAAKVTPSAAKVTQPAAKVTPSATKPIPAAANPTKPATKATQPAAKGTQPAAKGTQPAAKATQPAAKATQSAAKATQSAAKGTQPAAKATQSAAKATQSAAKATQSAAKATQSATRKDASTDKAEELTKEMKQVKIEEKKVDEINITLAQIAGVIFDDNTGQIEATKKWPLVLDKNGNVDTFVRYRDVNYLDTFNPSNMEPERIRLIILGAIRFGKELVVYTHNQLEAMWSIFSEKLNSIYPTLLQDMMTRKIIEDDYYKNLIREEDSDEYSQMEFSKSQMYELNKKFKLILLTNDETIQKFTADWLIVTVV